MDRKQVSIWIGSAEDKNEKIGVWVASLVYKKYDRLVSNTHTISERFDIELDGIIGAVACLKEPCDVTIYTDSRYIIDSINNKWFYGWAKNNWYLRDHTKVKNINSWAKVIGLLKTQKIKMVPNYLSKNTKRKNLVKRTAKSYLKSFLEDLNANR